MLNCATSAGVSRAPAGAAGWPEPSTNAGIRGQWLFRAEVSSAAGAGSLRLVLRRFDATRFSLRAADAFGQEQWELRSDRTDAVWLEPQAQRFCRLDARLALRSQQWVSSISVSDIAGLLTGEWPFEGALALAPVPPSFSSSPVAPPRRITGARTGKSWTSWTLWEGAEPVAWFKRIGFDSLLSVRQPAVQVRWRVTARGDLGDPRGASFTLLPGEVFASAREIACPDNAIP